MRRSSVSARLVSGTLAGAALLGASLGIGVSAARADEVTELGDIAAVQRACREATGPGERVLYAVTVPRDEWRFGGMQLNEIANSDATGVAVAETGTLFVDTQHNLRIVGGRAEVLPAGLEPIGFTVSRERARLLERARTEGASLRLGFFLGMDGRDGTLCVVRSTAAVTLVRAEVAFLELVSASGRVVAREDTERLRSLRDDVADDPQEQGPRASIAAPYGNVVPPSWEAALTAAPRGAVGRALSACHAAGLARGAATDGSVVVRLDVLARTGAVNNAEVELAANGDEDEARCVVRALRSVTLPAVTDVRDERVYALSVPVHLLGEVPREIAAAPAPAVPAAAPAAPVAPVAPAAPANP
jgi:hypothetical protein